MPKYIITWNLGYGEKCATIAAASLASALNNAYEVAKQEFEANVSWDAREYSERLAKECGLE